MSVSNKLGARGVFKLLEASFIIICFTLITKAQVIRGLDSLITKAGFLE